jgi:hypothetical protein
MNPEEMEKYQQDRAIIRMMVRTRDDFQSMRKIMDNRLGRKADGTPQKLKDDRKKMFSDGDKAMFTESADAARGQEDNLEEKLLSVLERMPIYNEWLKTVDGIGPISAGWICGEYDINKATTVSKMWSFTGLNPGMVLGKKRIKNDDGTFTIETTDQLVRADRLTPGFVSPFNTRLRIALVGVMADGFIRAQNSYCLDYYYPYKTRLENSVKTVLHLKEEVAWNEVSKGHRDRAAKRYMVKMFLKDLYNQWRPLYGLLVRPTYAEEYLNRKHAAT